MTGVIVAIVSGKGSPGASTTALGMTLTWPRPVLLFEADPAGASIALGYAAAADTAGRGLTGVRVAARRMRLPDALWANVVSLGETCWLLPGAATLRQAEALDYASIGAALPDLGVDVIIDAGRIPAPVAHHLLWARATTVLVAMRSTLPAVHAAQVAAAALEAMRTDGTARPSATVMRSVVIGAGRPYSERDIRAAMGDVARVAGQVAWDPASAAALVDALPAPHPLARSSLLRSTTQLATSLIAQAESPVRVAADHAAVPPVALVAERSRAVEKARPSASKRVRDLLVAARTGGERP